MRRNISDLLDRYPAEDVELGEFTPYSPSRIKELTMKEIKMNQTNQTNKAKGRFKPTHMLAAAAVVAALSVSALAAGSFLKGSELFGDVFSQGGGSLSQGQLDTIDRLAQSFEGQDGSIPAAVTDNGATITPIAALADENVYYLRLRVEAPEGAVLPDLDPDRDGKCYQLFGPEGEDLITLEPAQGAYPQDAFGYNLDFSAQPDSNPNDNVKEFVMQFTGFRDEGVKFNDGVSKVLTIHGLWTQDVDKGYTPIFTGEFSFDIGLNFQSQDISLDAAGLTWTHGILGYTNTMQSMSLSPLSLSYQVDSSMPVNDHIGAMVGDIQIVLKDGTVFYSETTTEYDNEVLAHSLEVNEVSLPLTGEPTGVFENYILFDEPLDLTQVDYVQYGDTKIPVNAE